MVSDEEWRSVFDAVVHSVDELCRGRKHLLKPIYRIVVHPIKHVYALRPDFAPQSCSRFDLSARSAFPSRFFGVRVHAVKPASTVCGYLRRGTNRCPL